MIISKGTPHEQVNPPYTPYMWTDSTTGELFVCTDNTRDANQWVGMKGTVIGTPFTEYDLATTPSGWFLESSATQETGYIQITPAVNSSWGALSLLTPKRYTFLDISFEGYVFGGNGADGLAVRMEDSTYASDTGVQSHWATWTNAFNTDTYVNNATATGYAQTHTGITEYRFDGWKQYRHLLIGGYTHGWWDGVHLGSMEIGPTIPKSFDTIKIRGFTGGANDIHRIRNLSYAYA